MRINRLNNIKNKLWLDAKSKSIDIESMELELYELKEKIRIARKYLDEYSDAIEFANEEIVKEETKLNNR